MPLFGVKKTHNQPVDGKSLIQQHQQQPEPTSANVVAEESNKLTFYCQLAHGGSTGVISGFTNVKELYQKIGECFDMDPNEILFCTLNTYKINMGKLLGGQIALNDFIFVHRKGQTKEIELCKNEAALGLTITDNGNGLAFIKRIKEGSVIDHVPVIEVGDHIEKINDINLVGKRHFEVAKCIQEIPVGSSFTIRLVSPIKAGFVNIAPRSQMGKSRKSGYGSGRQTLRFKAGGEAVVEVVDDIMDKAVQGINSVLESFFGISDSELATQIWEASRGCENSVELGTAIYNCDLYELQFTDDVIIELWGVITDARAQRL